MKIIRAFRVHSAIASAALLAMQIAAAESPREHLSLDAGWKFHLGDDWPDALHRENSGTGSGPASEKFADTYWRVVNLPHDWAVELPFDWAADGSHGFKPLGTKFPTNSIGWYRRTFELPKEDQVKRIWLTFAGVMHDATVWVNGWCVRRHEGGYYPFREDITVHFGGKNTIAVRVDATASEGWFYEGAGIYRHVCLDLTAPVAIAPDGIFVVSSFKNNVPSDHAVIHIEVDLLNTLTNDTKATVNCELNSPDGTLLNQFDESVKVNPQSRQLVSLESKLSSPVLWSPESPKLFKLLTTVSVAGKIVDQKETSFVERQTLRNSRHLQSSGSRWRRRGHPGRLAGISREPVEGIRLQRHPHLA